MSSKDWDCLAAVICGVLNVVITIYGYHYMFGAHSVNVGAPASVITTYSGK